MKKENTEQLKSLELAFVFLAIIVIAFIFFGNGIKGQFVYDDEWVIMRNPTVVNVSQIFHQFVLPYHYMQPETGLYRPLTIISYTLNFVLSKSPSGFHVINILLHALNTFLVFFIIFKIFNSKRLAYLTSLLFLFLPIHIEAITFISGRSDLLAFLFALLALLMFHKEKYWLGSAAFLLGLLSKESGVFLVPAIFVFWLWNKRENLAIVVKKSFLYFLPPAAIYSLLRYVALKENFLANDATYVYNPLKFTDITTRFYTGLKVMTMYLWKTFVPLHFSADYSFNQIPLLHSMFNLPSIAGLLVLISIVALIFWKRTRNSILALGSVIFTSSYFVISNFIFPIGTVMAERTFYLPSLGVAMIIAFVLEKLVAWKFSKFWLFFLVLILIFWGVFIIRWNNVWLNKGVLYQNMVKESPNSVHAKNNLGVYYIQQGRWDEGKKLLEEVYKITPDHVPTVDALGIVAEHEKKYGDAEKFYLRALELRPFYATSMSNLGRMYFQLGQYQKSADLYKKMFDYKNQPSALLIFAMSQSKLGNYDLAISTIKKFYGESPKDLNLKFALGYAYYKKGDKETAFKYFKESKNPAISDEEFIKSIEKF